MKIEKNIVYTGSKGRQSLLDVYYKQDNHPKEVIIFCHGFKGYKDWGCFDLMAEEFAKNNLVFIKFNFSFNGGTLENPIDFPDLEAFSNNNLTTELKDLDIILNLLEKGEILPLQEINLNKITLIGHSRGGGISIIKAVEDKRISSLITWAAVSDFESRFVNEQMQAEWAEKGVIYIENQRTKQQMPIKYQFYDDFSKNKNKFDILENIKLLTIPHLIIHGDNDTTVSMIEATQIHENSPYSELHILPNTNHNFDAFQPWILDNIPANMQLAIEKSINFIKI